MCIECGCGDKNLDQGFVHTHDGHTHSHPHPMATTIAIRTSTPMSTRILRPRRNGP